MDLILKGPKMGLEKVPQICNDREVINQEVDLIVNSSDLSLRMFKEKYGTAESKIPEKNGI